MLLMKRFLRIALSIVLLLSAARLDASEQPKAEFTSMLFDFGKVVEGEKIRSHFVVRNRGTVTLNITGFRMSTPLQALRVPPEIRPGGEEILEFVLDTSGLKGDFEGRIILTLNDPQLSEPELVFRGRVLPRMEVLPVPAFYVAGTRGQPKQSSLEIVNHLPEPVVITAVQHPTERFTTKLETLVEGQRYKLTLTLNPAGPGGKHTETIVLRTSNASLPLFQIPANTYLHERVYTFPDVLDMGVLRLAGPQFDRMLTAQAAQTLMVYQTGGKSFDIKLSSDLPSLQLKAERGSQADRWQITAMLMPDKIEPGPIKGSITIETNDPEFRRLLVPVTGIIVPR
jgi:hypothetical protein